MKRISCVFVLIYATVARSSAFATSIRLNANNAASVPSSTTVASVLSKRSLPARHEPKWSTSPLALSISDIAKATPIESTTSASKLTETLRIGSYFTLWYLFNIAYNIYNKQVLNVLDFPWTVAMFQMAAGILYFVPLWLLGIRKAPKLSRSDLKTLLPIALCHTGVHVGAVIALGAGAVSFAHIVKASEPVVTCALNAALLGETLPVSVYATLLPIIGGVAIASMKELSFSWLALGSAMLSNVSSAARGVLSKKTMSGKKVGENMDAQNLYGVLTAMSTLILIPLAFALEGTKFFEAFRKVVSAGEYTQKSLTALIALSGATYYAYNEVAFLALGKVNPVTHAVGNTIKRVVIIVASVIAFNTPMSPGSIIGSTIAIAGTLMYSLAMNVAKSKT